MKRCAPADPDGSYVWSGNDKQISGTEGSVCSSRPRCRRNSRLENYQTILFSGSGQDNMAKAFFNTLTVTIPATIIPIVIAAFAAYALAWMEFPGRALLIAAVVALLVVPLQLALIPLLRLHLGIGIGKGYMGSGLRTHGLRDAARGLSAAKLHGRTAHGTSSKTPRSTARQISRFSPGSSCHSVFRRSPPLRSSSSCGPGTIFWWQRCS